MALYPSPAIHKLIPPGENDPRIKVVGVVLHVRDGLGDSLYDYFNGPSGGVESHGYIRFTGVEEQYRDDAYEADANLDGNSFWRDGVGLCGFASIETEGLAAGLWTPAQIITIKKRLIWYRDVHGVPLKVATAWNGEGVGFHTMWGSPSHWTPVSKSCPGYDRIKQFWNIIVPWMEAGAPPPEGEDDVDKKELQETLEATLRGMKFKINVDGEIREFTLETILYGMEMQQDFMRTQSALIQASAKGIKAAIAALQQE